MATDANGKTRQNATPTKMTTVERRRQAVALRLAGSTYEAIGTRLGISRQAAAKHVLKAMEKAVEEYTSEGAVLVQMELRRLEDLQRGVYVRAMQGDVFAIDRILKIMQRRAQLLGLDAPAKTEEHATGEVTVRVVREDNWGVPT